MKLRDNRAFDGDEYPIFNANTGEIEKETPKMGLNVKWRAFKKRWSERCWEEKGIQPVIAEKERFTFFRVRKLYGQDQMEEIITYFLGNKKSNEHLTINACFSADSINSWKLHART